MAFFLVLGVLLITGDLCRGRDLERDLESDHDDLRLCRPPPPLPRLRTGDPDFLLTGDLDLLFLLRIGGKPGDRDRLLECLGLDDRVDLEGGDREDPFLAARLRFITFLTSYLGSSLCCRFCCLGSDCRGDDDRCRDDQCWSDDDAFGPR